MVEDTVCTIGVYGGRQPSILVNNHLVYGRMPDSETQPDIIADVPKNRLVANLNPASDGMTDSPRLPLELFAAWLANGDVGLSSLAIVQRLTGITMTVNGTREHGCEDTPKDPGDLRRILGMFDMVPVARAYLSSCATCRTIGKPSSTIGANSKNSIGKRNTIHPVALPKPTGC